MHPDVDEARVTADERPVRPVEPPPAAAHVVLLRDPGQRVAGLDDVHRPGARARHGAGFVRATDGEALRPAVLGRRRARVLLRLLLNRAGRPGLTLCLPGVARADRPRAPALSVLDLVGDGDLLLAAGEVGAGGVRRPAVVRPGALGELQA